MCDQVKVNKFSWWKPNLVNVSRQTSSESWNKVGNNKFKRRQLGSRVSNTATKLFETKMSMLYVMQKTI